MYLDAQEKTWVKAIADESVNDIEGFINKFCEIDTVSTNVVQHWTPYKFDTKRWMVPKDEDKFLKQLYAFTSLIDKLLNNSLITFSIKFVGYNDLLPVFRKGGNSFIEVWELLKNKQGLIIISTLQLKEFINNNFVTDTEKKFRHEQHRRINAERWTRGIALVAIITQVLTAVTLFILESKREGKDTVLSQKLAYYTTIAQRKIFYSEKIIEDREKAIIWLGKYQKEKDTLEKKDLNQKWFQISEEMKVNNSTSLIYSNQPYNAVMNFDDLFREISLKVIDGSLSDSLYDKKRKELGKRFDILINTIGENTMGDSAYINFISGQRLDTERIRESK